jgi:hypothetical protein
MKHATSTLAAILVTAAVGGAAAQAPDGNPAQPAAPRVEMGGGVTFTMPISTDGVGVVPLPMADARAGVALNRRWTIEGIVDVWPEGNGTTTIYRAQARWQLPGEAAPGRWRAYVTFGGAGWISHRSYPESRWQDFAGTVYVNPARSYWNASAPIYPTVGFGAQKSLGARIALRVELAAVVIPYDDGATTLLMPSVSLSIPIGRYPVRAR